MNQNVYRAMLFAEKAHEGQVRKYTGEPYVTHPMEVRSIFMTYVPEAEEHEQIACLLHDTVEDTPVTLSMVEAEFGYAVKVLVGQLTDQYTREAYPELNRAARTRLEAERIGKAMVKTQMIKCADLISNTRAIHQLDPGFAKVYLPEKVRLLSLMHACVRNHAIWQAAYLQIPEEYRS
jgi:(p)ppGpp synthase/HD superfamily hydrolase